jgi:hypothetical protein
MGLDVYVGSLTRHYARDWETVVQRLGRETNTRVEVIRPEEPADAITDPEEIRTAVLQWRTLLAAALARNGVAADWDERAAAPYFTDKPGWDCYASLKLWAAYAEHPDLRRPTALTQDLASDPAYARSTERAYRSSFSQLIGDVEVWLPADFPFTFRGPDPTGRDVDWGSSVALRRQLETLNARTWRATPATITEWRREAAASQASLEEGARFAFAVMFELAALAVEHRLVMKLDY